MNALSYERHNRTGIPADEQLFIVHGRAVVYNFSIAQDDRFDVTERGFAVRLGQNSTNLGDA